MNSLLYVSQPWWCSQQLVMYLNLCAFIINGYITLTVWLAFYPQSSAPSGLEATKRMADSWKMSDYTVRFRSLLPPDGLQGNSASDVTSVYPPSMWSVYALRVQEHPNSKPVNSEPLVLFLQFLQHPRQRLLIAGKNVWCDCGLTNLKPSWITVCVHVHRQLQFQALTTAAHFSSCSAINTLSVWLHPLSSHPPADCFKRCSLENIAPISEINTAQIHIDINRHMNTVQ